jgi:predicted component of type VI protein secretion system
MPPQLVALTDGPSMLLDKPILLIGRHQECDIQIASRKISRRHCCIAQVNDHLVVRDLGSTNGIRINGVRVAEGRLNAGDEFTIANFRYEVRWSAQPGEAFVPHAPQPPVPAKRPAARAVDLESVEEPIAIHEPSAERAAPPRAPALSPPVIPEDLSLLPRSGGG